MKEIGGNATCLERDVTSRDDLSSLDAHRGEDLVTNH
jgi:hypothetical protein